jgi:hypothetical protein
MEILEKFESYLKFHLFKFLSTIDKNRLSEKLYMEKVFISNYHMKVLTTQMSFNL